MKRKLNLNGPASTFLALLGVFLVAVPGGLYLLLLLLDALRWPAGAIPYLIKGSLAIGAGILALFVALIIVEHFQDEAMDHRYRQGRRRKTPLADGRYECQFCGNRQLRADDRRCPLCGERLE